MRFMDTAFEIVPAEHRPERVEDDDLSTALARLSTSIQKGLGASDREMKVWSELPVALDEYASTLRSGLGEGGAGQLKVFFGKQTYLGSNVLQVGSRIDLADFSQTFRYGTRREGYRTRFNNNLTKRKAAGLGSILVEKFGFVKQPTVVRGVASVVNRRWHCNNTICYNLPQTGDGPPELVGCFGMDTSLGMLPIVCGGHNSDLLDVRLNTKTCTEATNSRDPDLVAFSQGAILNDHQLVFEPSNSFVCSKYRINTVTPYTGIVAGRDVTVEVAHVDFTLQNRTTPHWEVHRVVEITPLLSSKELAEVVAFAMDVAAELPSQLESSGTSV